MLHSDPCFNYYYLDRECHGGVREALKMVLVCPCAALTEGLVSLYIVCMCVNCLNIYYINLIVSFFVFVYL